MVEYIKFIFILLLAVSAINCENCVTYDFGSNFYDSFDNDNPLCVGFANWELGNYSTVNIGRPHEDTELFITPGVSLSCVSSYEFEMQSTGTVEVYVYMESTSQRDQIIVLANEVSSSGNNVVAGTVILTPSSTNYYNGWHVLKIDLVGPENFNGYVSFLGSASPDSKVIIDSFRYVPPQYDDNCHVYDGDFVTSSPQEPESIESEDCVAFNFESDFDAKFDHDSGLCASLQPWNLEQYTSLPIANPNSESLQFISPQDLLSCVSSFPFEASNGGVVEINVYIESVNSNDQITVVVNQIVNGNGDVVIGSAGISPLLANYADGWHTLRVSLSADSGIFNAYINFLGSASEESIVLIDSFRYIPPTIASDTCQIYEDEVVETTTSVPETTVAPIGTGEECITYDFETNFETSFGTNTAICNGYSSWYLGDYYSLGIDSINPDSKTFISPNETLSCISSFVFRMLPGGVINVNVFVKSVSNLDHVIVLAKKVVASGVDTVAGSEIFYASDNRFVDGWNVLQVTVLDLSIFDGYITLFGSTAEDSIVLVDSFSYTPPNYDPCQIY